MMMAVGHTDVIGLLAAPEGNGALLQLIVVGLVMLISVIGGLLNKKKQDREQEQEPPQGRRRPPAPPAPPVRWPPTGPTSSTQRRPGPQAPPIARPAPQIERQDDARERLERLERERRERTSRIEQEMVDRAERFKREARAEEMRLKTDAARRAREAAQQRAQHAASRPAPPTRAAAPIVPQPQIRQMASNEKVAPGLQMQAQVNALLTRSDWRTAIIMAELLSPPLALRDPNGPAGTTPPSLST